MITLGGCLYEAEDKRICQISGLKSGCDVIRNFKQWSLTGEALKQYLTEKQNGCFQSGRLREVVAYKRWSRSES